MKTKTWITIHDDENGTMVLDGESAKHEIDARIDNLLAGSCGFDFEVSTVEMTDEEVDNLPEE